jgi:polyphosphate kinase
LYQGSADWMNRNLERRIEVVFPVKNEIFKKQIVKMLEFQLHDNTRGVMLDENLNNIPIVNNEKRIRSQVDFYDYLKENA